MCVYSLIAPTRSEIREVLLSISLSEPGDLNRRGDPDQRGASSRRFKNREQRLQHFRSNVHTREIGRQLPKIGLAMTAQQRIDLFFQIAGGQRVWRRAFVLGEEHFQFHNFRFLFRGQILAALIRDSLP